MPRLAQSAEHETLISGSWESWSQQLDNKLHSVKPVIGAWPVMPMRRTDVKLTRLRIGHTRFTHRHLLFGERAPECPSCHVSYTGFNVLTNVWRSIARFGSCAIKPNTHSLTRRRKLSLAYYTKILSVPSHPLQNVYMSTSMKRLYDARPSNIRPFMDRMKLHISELDLPNVRIQQRNLFLFQPWNTPRFHYINPFATYSKSTVAPVVFQRVFAYHRSQYSRYSAIYTDGSKRADYVGCGVVIEDIMHGYRLDTSCSIFTAEAVAIYRALQLIDSTMPRKYCIYTDSMSVFEALENYHDRCHPVVCTILDITSRLYSKGFDIVFCWLPSHVGIIGNEQADSAANSATTHLPLAVPLSDMKRVIMHHIFNIWQESWSQQLDNNLHSVKPVIGAWPVMPLRRTDVKLTRLRIGHTRFTHRHLLFGERAPECPSCHVSYTVHHILIDCPVFNHHRITFFINLF
ncbi:RNase H domain-containing protein [Trichonephila clavipes]|nr:RNase H domain-containing protein [Trichonephila clavipes]